MYIFNVMLHFFLTLHSSLNSPIVFTFYSSFVPYTWLFIHKLLCILLLFVVKHFVTRVLLSSIQINCIIIIQSVMTNNAGNCALYKCWAQCEQMWLNGSDKPFV